LLARLFGFVLFLFEVRIDDGAEGQAIAILHRGEFIYGKPPRLCFVQLLDLVGLLSSLSERRGMEGMSFLNPIDKGSYEEGSYQG
jgi:hypothetical protein